MEIRTITVGAREADLPRAARAAQEAKQRLEAAGYTVQTLRLALLAVADVCADFVTVAQGAEAQALDAGFDFVSLGPLDHRRLPDLPAALVATEAVFASTHIASVDGTVYAETISAAAEAIVGIGARTENGFGNLRFAALACVPPGSPFFPAAYHDTGEPWLAVGPEAATLAVDATTNDQGAGSVVGGRSSVVALTRLIEQHDAAIRNALEGLQAATRVRYAGCDWSLAPHPDPARSIGAAVEAISGVPFGAWGTLSAVRALTASIRAAQVTQLGFSGVMLPVLEDATLAQRNTEGRYTLRDLLAFSAVCGTGLDTIPLAGDTTPVQVAAILSEVAALAAAHRKPLTARLMPIPGLAAGGMTTFDFPYFVNTRAMPVG